MYHFNIFYMFFQGFLKFYFKNVVILIKCVKIYNINWDKGEDIFMKKKIFITLFLLIILLANMSFASYSTVTMDVV